ncbi:MAG: hypothetical protein H6R26_1921, partial [Proteobacteria bacterium]|nr:hypothetical protein [Pseudomonadota bacterium]
QMPDQPAPFSQAQPGAAFPPGWIPTVLAKVPRTTRFSLVEDAGRTVLRAVSEAAASSLTYKLRVDPTDTPRLTWRWKVSRVIDKGDLATKAGDDFAARVYVFFDYDVSRLPFLDRAALGLARALYGSDLPAATLCYVWDNRYPVGTNTWSAYTHQVRMIVLESGSAKVGRWVEESRDVAEDFRRAFHDTAPTISGISVAADTDNTGENVVTHFGDFVFESARGRRP